MAKDTPSMAKNKMRRCFQAIIDPHPSKSEIDSLWEYFDSSCAYCGVEIDRSSRTGHVDHAVSSATGGSNDIHNHMLSCAKCNGDERREEPWRDFLSRKADHSSQEFKTREARIQYWLQMGDKSRRLDEQYQGKADVIIAKAIQDFDHAVEQLRKLRKNGS